MHPVVLVLEPRDGVKRWTPWQFSQDHKQLPETTGPVSHARDGVLVTAKTVPHVKDKHSHGEIEFSGLSETFPEARGSQFPTLSFYS